MSNNCKNKHCDHCDRNSHTIEECWTLQFDSKFCDRRSHNEDICKFKNSTWVPNDTRTQGSWHIKPRGSFLATHTADTTPMHGAHSHSFSTPTQPASQSNHLRGLSIEQFQQLAHVVSVMSSTHSFGNNNAYANAAGVSFFHCLNKLCVNQTLDFG